MKGIPEFKPPKPMRLQWELQDPAVEAIDRAYEVGIHIPVIFV